MKTDVDLKLKSKYTGVYYKFSHNCKKSTWVINMSIKGLKAFKEFPFTDEGERAAALCYDMKMIEIGKQPVNILVKK